MAKRINTVGDFRAWLGEKLDRVTHWDRLCSDSDEEETWAALFAKQAFDNAGAVARQASNNAAKVGLPAAIQDRFQPFWDHAEPWEVRSLIISTLADCELFEPASDWLTLTEASKITGVTVETLREWCNYIDPDTNKHTPKIKHKRVDTRGRPNPKTGLQGTIKICRTAAEEFAQSRTLQPAPTRQSVPTPPPKYKRQNF